MPRRLAVSTLSRPRPTVEPARSRRTSASTSAVCSSHVAASGASRLRRSSGSVLLGRRLNHQSPQSTVSPSRRSCEHRRRTSAATVSMTASGIVDPGVDLAALHVALERLAQLRERNAGAAELLEHEQRGDRAGVGAPVVAEVVVRGVLAAEDRAGLGHDLLDERVADARAHRNAAVLADDLGHRVRADEVVARRSRPDGGRGCRPRRSRWWSSRSPARPCRRRGTRGRRRRRTRARCRR